MITQRELKDLLYYDTNTGVFKSKVNRYLWKIGKNVGYKRHGYLGCSINNKQYYLHRLVWLYVEGYFPEYYIDHINGIRDDNRWCNLRHITQSCNIKNQIRRSDNISNVTGVSFCKETNSWRATIYINGKQKKFKRRKNKIDAAKDRYKAEKDNNYEICKNNSDAYYYLKKKGLF